VFLKRRHRSIESNVVRLSRRSIYSRIYKHGQNLITRFAVAAKPNFYIAMIYRGARV